MADSKTKRMFACPRCRFPNAERAKRCLSCGASLEPEPAPPPAAPSAPPAREPEPYVPVSSLPQPTVLPSPGVYRMRVGNGPPAPTVDAAGTPLARATPPPPAAALAPPRTPPDDDESPYGAPESDSSPAPPPAEAAAPPPDRALPPPTALEGREQGLGATRPVSAAALRAALAGSAPPQSQVPAVAPDDPRIVAWLECVPFPPIPLGPTPVLTIGRGAEADLVLPHPGVSRTHAVIRAAGRALLFEDRSTYGSYVNGERVISRELAVGDALVIGPYELSVRGRDDAPAADARAVDETRPLALGAQDLQSADAMSGRLEKQPLTEVLQALEFNQKTGTLDLVCGDVAGRLVVYEGMPMFASFGPLEGAEAVFAMIEQRRGYYTFRRKVEAGERTLTVTITALLLEASRRLDEDE